MPYCKNNMHETIRLFMWNELKLYPLTPIVQGHIFVTYPDQLYYLNKIKVKLCTFVMRTNHVPYMQYWVKIWLNSTAGIYLINHQNLKSKQYAHPQICVQMIFERKTVPNLKTVGGSFHNVKISKMISKWN